MQPLVSILIPTYNSQEWIAETLRSALAQSWQRKEIIVVDDGSTDHTLSIARRFESNCLKVVAQDNQGAAAARNQAFSLSQGDYLQWLDADDLMAPDKLALQVAALQRSATRRTIASCSWGWFMYRYDRAKLIPTALWCDLPPLEWLIRKMGQHLFMPTSTWLVSRELTEVAGPWDTRMLVDDDGEYFCRVLLASDGGVRFIPEARLYYRFSGFGSLSHIGCSERKREAQWLSMQLHIGYLRSLEDSERVRNACVRYLQHWLPSFYPERPDIVKEANEMARCLGGQLVSPRLSWKYSWIKALFGWRFAKRARMWLLNGKWSAVRLWDKALFRMAGQARKPRPAFAAGGE